MHVMLDLETLSTRPNAAIIAIGAVAFDPAEERVLTHFHAGISPRSAASYGAMDIDTICWWMQQSDAAGDEWNGARTSIEALCSFRRWLEATEHTFGLLQGVWGNGAAFDNVVLAHAFEAPFGGAPWSHKQDRCYRTLRALFPHIEEPPFEGERHTALADAMHQAKHCMRLLAAVEGRAA